MLKYKNFWGRFRSRLDCRCTTADVLNFGMVSLRPLQVDHVFGFRQLGCLAGMRQPGLDGPCTGEPFARPAFPKPVPCNSPCSGCVACRPSSFDRRRCSLAPQPGSIYCCAGRPEVPAMSTLAALAETLSQLQAANAPENQVHAVINSPPAQGCCCVHETGTRCELQQPSCRMAKVRAVLPEFEWCDGTQESLGVGPSAYIFRCIYNSQILMKLHVNQVQPLQHVLWPGLRARPELPCLRSSFLRLATGILVGYICGYIYVYILVHRYVYTNLYLSIYIYINIYIYRYLSSTCLTRYIDVSSFTYISISSLLQRTEFLLINYNIAQVMEMRWKRVCATSANRRRRIRTKVSQPHRLKHVCLCTVLYGHP